MDITSDIRREHRRIRNDYVALLLLLMAALGQPLFVRLLCEFDHDVALFLPSIVIVLSVCLIRPDPALPILTILAIYAVELPSILLPQSKPTPSIVGNLMQGEYYLLGVPVAAVALGYAAVLARRRMPLWRWPIQSNLPILSAYPWRFIKAYRWPLLLLAVGATLDTTTTMDNMYRYGIETEFHPAMKIAAETYGVTLGVPVGTVVRLMFVVFVAAIWRRWCGGILVLCGVLYILAAANNHFLWL